MTSCKIKLGKSVPNVVTVLCPEEKKSYKKRKREKFLFIKSQKKLIGKSRVHIYHFVLDMLRLKWDFRFTRKNVSEAKSTQFVKVLSSFIKCYASQVLNRGSMERVKGVRKYHNYKVLYPFKPLLQAFRGTPVVHW